LYSKFCFSLAKQFFFYMSFNFAMLIGRDKLTFLDVVWFVFWHERFLPFAKVILLEEEDTCVLLMDFPCVIYPNSIQSIHTLWAFNNLLSFCVVDDSYDCLHIVSSFSSALTFLRDLDISTYDRLKASARLFFSFSIFISLLNNFLFNFLTFTTSSHKSSYFPITSVHD